MRAFDHEMAWAELARPAFEELPESIHQALAAVAEQADDLSQLPDLTMPWPANGTLRAGFEALDSADLARAARVIYDYGRWWPSSSAGSDALTVPARSHGASWKFSHYADQILRERLSIPLWANRHGFSVEIHEGVIRLCYASKNEWNWAEIAPATADGLATARAEQARIQQAIAAAGVDRFEALNILSREFDALRAKGNGAPYNTAPYMIEESAIAARQAKTRPAADTAKLIKQAREKCQATIDNATAERDGLIWLLEHGLDTKNAIYYNHTGRWAFGWYKPIDAETKSQMLDVLCEAPFDYDFTRPGGW